MAVLSVASHRMEPLFDEAIRLNIGGVTIFDYCKLEEEASPTLLERLAYKAKQANMPICGGNCMGYYNVDNDAYISFQSLGARKAGHISLIAHSGSIFVLPTSNDRRFRSNNVHAFTLTYNAIKSIIHWQLFVSIFEIHKTIFPYLKDKK